MGKHIKKYGFSNARNFVNNLKNEVEENNKVVLKQIGLLCERAVVKFIARQPSGWAPLKPSYLDRKIKEGYSALTLRRTGTMINAITSVEKYPEVFIGVKRGVKYNSGQDVANIAAIMEFGSAKQNIPARPFLYPVMKMMRIKIVQEKIFEKSLMDRYRKKYFGGKGDYRPSLNLGNQQARQEGAELRLREQLMYNDFMKLLAKDK